jgi:hypothetical protein
MSEDRALEIQTAAPPLVPPKRPTVGAALVDDHADWPARLQENARQLAALREWCDAILATHRETIGRLDALRSRLDDAGV